MELKQQLIAKLTEMLRKSGGKQAAKFILNSLGAMHFVENVLLTSGNVWSERDQQNLNEKIEEWIESDNVDLPKAINILESELNEPTKSSFAFLLWESLELEIPFIVQVGTSPIISAILNPQTLQEFERFEKAGLITIVPTENISSLGTGIKFSKSFEDKKRPMGFGVSVVIKINEKLYQ